MACVFGYTNEFNQGSYQEYVLAYHAAGEPLNKMKELFHFTAQADDDWTEETCFNIDKYNEQSKECDGIFIQLSQKPSETDLAMFKKRVENFGLFYASAAWYNHQGIKAEAMCFETVTVKSKINGEHIF